MSSRKVPPLANAWNASVARLAAVAPQLAAEPARRVRRPIEPSEQNPAALAAPWSSRLGVTWLSDMLTADRNSFAVVRMLLALAVLVSHSIYLTTGQGALDPVYPWTNYTLGQHGVQVFFFLSGILVAQSLFASRDLRDYATARALRVFPALIACVLLTALVVGPLLTTLPPADYLKDQGVAAYIAKTISLWSGSGKLPGLFANNPVPGDVNTSVWTLKYEVLCYALLGLAGWCVIRLQRWRETAFALIALWLAVALYKPAGLELHGGDKSTFDVLRYFTIFFGAGVLAFVLRHYIPVHTALLLPLGVMFWAAIGTRFQEPAAAVCLGYLALWAATFRFGALRDLTNQSDYSYATYLYHMPVSQVLLHFWPQMPLVPLILATTGIVIWLAFLSWELIERPALSLRHRLWKKSAPASAEQALDHAVASAETAASKSAAHAVESNGSSASTALPIGREKPSSPAEIAAARAAARLAREMAIARKQSDAVQTATVEREKAPQGNATTTEQSARRDRERRLQSLELAQNETAPKAASLPDKPQPPAAQVWRPMPSVKRLRIHADEAVATPDSEPELTRGRATMPLDLIKRAAAAMPTMPAAPVNWNAIKSATRRAPRAESIAPEAEATRPTIPLSRIAFATKRPAAADVMPIEPERRPELAPSEPSRAVVAVQDDGEADIRPRVAQPRPAWTPPMGASRAN